MESDNAMNRRIFVMSLLGMGLPILAAAEGPAKPIIVLQPMGDISPKDVAVAEAGILTVYDVAVRVLPKLALPKAAYYPPRERYRAEKLLDFLGEDHGLDFEPAKIVGLTAVDISTTKGEVEDWGVLGLGTLEGVTCVISTFRLGARKASAAKRLERLIKVVNHEIGHTFGLDHCPTPHCLMEDARGTIATVDGEDGGFCQTCRQRLGKALKAPGR
jgi:archaemetzincin